MTATDMLQSEGGVSIIAENAMAEVEKYLSQARKEKATVSRKKKILLVDDSELMLRAMQSLLDNDYEIILAQSGTAAIRCIILDKPDLVLLDYEMPVCNGRQVLEMIRSEKEFRDTPVIFLTNMVDQESVRKVIALKPEGYLLKTLPAEAVKKEVDRFFEKRCSGKKQKKHD